MKKSLFFVAAASALMLTACSSESDVLQDTAQTQKTAVQEQAVGFDIYTPAASSVTRAGLEGTMTTNRLQRSEYDGGGFGVYAYQVQDEIPALGDGDNATKYENWMSRTSPAKKPNFMVNQKLLWNATNQGWYYNPLKYWPNETDNDSQTSPAEMIGSSSKNHVDRLSFFAYAPYVAEGTTGEEGITNITTKEGYLEGGSTTVEPTISYQAAMDDPNKAVDLLWGVAPAGGLTYTAVNGRTVKVDEGMPLIDMTKPDVNTNMKFLFNHALARIGIKAVAAIDQVGAGGTLDPNTKITIKEITLTGLFGKTGDLNLDNTIANQANWVKLNGVDLTGATLASLQAVAETNRQLKIDVTTGTIAEHLQYIATEGSGSPAIYTKTDRVGVTTVKQDVIAPSKPGATTKLWATYKEYADGESFDYSESTPYYDNEGCTTLSTAAVTAPTGNAGLYTIESNGNIKQIANAASGTPTDVKYPKVNIWYLGEFYKVSSDDVTNNTYAGKGIQAYYLTTDAGVVGTLENGDVLSPRPVGTDPIAGDYIIKTKLEKATIKYKNSTGAKKKYYKRDANYFMVVPTKNYEKSITDETEREKLRTIRVKIEYYVTTEDSKLGTGRAITKNVVEKDVIFPSLENGKSYNLNLVLGLTSVKMEAEVDDWKVINVNADLPQNTAE